ncbi:hypothetical protein HOLleu_26372 [Holothuria leucospilota]|uniref:Uncharacterized protein n=1 Tax=Holothuria leucospilota TaxID=206669 RepID=A0A9Q1H2T2_HOLLE|nr:hypothetical protein HOLleu_26372 [Holothuria leucospilota]
MTLTEEIKSLDKHLEKRTVPQHLSVHRNRPKPPNLSLSTARWNFLSLGTQVIARAGRRFCRVWPQELSNQAKKQRQRFLEKESRAKLDLESTSEGKKETKKLLEKLLRSSAKRGKIDCGNQKAPRKHPYRR